ncbi:MAG TPA: hypothetical protein VL219_04315 [Steroidobacteraceae bacterium]|jgi:hypothetical protein|nr:hypothetical protein [Steroidobacteraceae bacterium]
MSGSRLVVISRRFRGPPTSGNGGYTCGMLAAAASKPVEVRLVSPPPLDEPLEITDDAATGGLQLKDSAGLVATATPKTFELDVPRPPTYAQALAAVSNYEGFQEHAYSDCFVCGPVRHRGDGMRIFASPIPGMNLVAAAWLPDRSLVGADGKVLPEFMWAALDCPGFFATGAAVKGPLLGTYAARIDRRVHLDAPSVVIGWSIRHDGRKHVVGTAVFDNFGELCGRALATWIEPRRPA